jgi:hypothetical protein
MHAARLQRFRAGMQESGSLVLLQLRDQDNGGTVSRS